MSNHVLVHRSYREQYPNVGFGGGQEEDGGTWGEGRVQAFWIPIGHLGLVLVYLWAHSHRETERMYLLIQQ